MYGSEEIPPIHTFNDEMVYTTDETGTAAPTIAAHTTGEEMIDGSAAVRDSSSKQSYKESKRKMLFKCQRCLFVTNDQYQMQIHKRACYNNSLPSIDTVEENNIHREVYSSAQNRVLQYIRFTPMIDMLPEDFLQNGRSLIQATIDELNEHSVESKIHPVISIQFKKLIDFEDGEEFVQYDNVLISLNAHQIVSIDAVYAQLLAKIEDFIMNGSDWVVNKVNWFDLRAIMFKSINHNKGHANPDGYKLPDRLMKKKAVINVKSKGEDCFKYALLSILNKDKSRTNHNLPQKYTTYLNDHNWEGIQMPMTAAQLTLFEKNNPGLYINLLEWKYKDKWLEEAEEEQDKKQKLEERDEEHRIHTIRQCKIPRTEDLDKCTIVNILCVPIEFDQWKQPTKFHYVGVTNLNRLLNSKENNKHKRIFCQRCHRAFHANVKLMHLYNDHVKQCYDQPVQSVFMPKEGSKRKFTNHQNIQRQPYAIYADIECILKKIPDSDEVEHIPIAIGIQLVPHPKMQMKPLPAQYEYFIGEDCIEVGLQYIEKVSREIYAWNKSNSHVKIIYKDTEQKQDHKKATKCYICKDAFDDDEKKKCADHDHLTGDYRGAACSICNKKMRLNRKTVSVFFHNAANYDNHLLCSMGFGKFKHWNLSVIPKTKERYLSIEAKFEVDKRIDKEGKEVNVYMSVYFKDSIQFMKAPLSVLGESLSKDKLVYTCKSLPDDSEIYQQKGVFPYDWFDCIEKLSCTSLPTQKEFYNKLGLEECSDEDYKRAQMTWDLFNCQTFCEYMLIYLKLDVMILADFFESFRELTLQNDGLDPCYYYTLPGITWDSSYKMTNVEVDLLDDIEMHEMFESGLRGGMTFVNEHEVKINSEELSPETYNPNKSNTELGYVDVNNLYGEALSMMLPHKNFKWIDDREKNMLMENLMQLDLKNGSIGYALEVDLHYPSEVQDMTEDLPFCPEKGRPKYDEFSQFMKDQWLNANQGENRRYMSSQKLLLTHGDKQNYVVHGLLLQFYLKHGLKLTKIHRGVSFEQSRLYKLFIDFNSEQRSASKTDFEKDYYKLKNNSLYGKNVENLRKRMNFRLSNERERSITYASNPAFLSMIHFNEDMVGILLCRDQVELNKPIFIGQAVLDLSKLIMYQWRFEKFPKYEKEFDGRIRAAGGDTDSFFLRVENMSVYNELFPAMKRDGILDTSKYFKTNPNHPLFTTEYADKLGCVKDECKGKPLRAMYLLRPKLYAMMPLDNDPKQIKKTAKGVQRSTIKNVLKFEDFQKSYELQKELYLSQTRISSKGHMLKTINFTKKAISVFEDKRVWIESNMSLPYYNHKLRITNPIPLTIARTSAYADITSYFKRVSSTDDAPTASKIPRLE